MIYLYEGGNPELCPGDSHEFSDHVSGDELDCLWLVVQAQSSERFPDSVFIAEHHDRAVTLALGWRL